MTTLDYASKTFGQQHSESKLSSLHRQEWQASAVSADIIDRNVIPFWILDFRLWIVKQLPRQSFANPSVAFTL